MNNLLKVATNGSDWNLWPSSHKSNVLTISLLSMDWMVMDFGKSTLILKFTFCALTQSLLVGRQEEHPACKNWVMRCWCSYLSGARCRLSAHGPADATAIPIISCLVKIQTGFTFLWLIQNLQSTPYLGSCGHENIGSVADSSAAKSDNCWVALLTGLGYHVVYFLHNQYTHPALTAAAYIYYTKHTVVVRNGNDALPSSSSEFVGLDTSQAFAALKQQVNMRSDGSRVLATAVVIWVER